MSRISAAETKVKSLSEAIDDELADQTCVCHIFMSANATFHGLPSPLQCVCTPQIPVRIWEGFPIYFAVIPDVQRINPESSLATPIGHFDRIHL
jgi:hypothetical protein